MSLLAPYPLPAACLFAGFIGDIPCFAAVDGFVHLPALGQALQAAEGGLTAAAAAPEGDALLTGGEDGTVRRLTFAAKAGAESAPQLELMAQKPGKWIDMLAAAPNKGGFAFSCGRQLCFSSGKAGAAAQEWQLPRSAEGLAFAPKGLRLAVARYNGVSLYWPGADTPPAELEWKGAHTGALFSPDQRYIITMMQENALHGWRLQDGQHLRMAGYPAKVKSASWSDKGRYLATGGAPAAILWPFLGKDGPLNKAPLELGTRGDSMVTCVACRPKREQAAIGYADGMILLAGFTDNSEIALRRGSAAGAPICALGWDKAGQRLCFSAENGEAGLISLNAAPYHQK